MRVRLLLGVPINMFDYKDWTNEHEAWSWEFHATHCAIVRGIGTHVICDGRDHYQPPFPTECEKLAIEEVEFLASLMFNG